MADVKISGLPASTTPLTGTEVVPVVQGGVTKKVSVDNLTAGKAVSVSGLTDSTLTASKAVFTDANKKLTSTGTQAVDQGGTGLSSVTSGQIVFGNSTTALATSAIFVYDNANQRLGIGTASPDHKLTVVNDANSQQWLRLKNLNAGSSASVGFLFGNDASDANGSLYLNSELNSGIGAAGGLVFGTYVGKPISFITGATEKIRLHSSGGVSVGNTTDPGAANLSVTGTVRTQGYTVSTLPAAGVAGRRAYVTDATLPTYLGALVGGGAVVCPVFDNGTAWVSA